MASARLRPIAFSLSLAALWASMISMPALAQRGNAKAQPGTQTVPLNAGSPLAGRYIVVLKDEVRQPGNVAADLGRAHGLTVDHVYAHALRGFSATLPDKAVERLTQDPRVAYVEQDQIATISALPTGIRRIGADSVTGPGGALLIDGRDDLRVDVDVAVLDTGADLDHPDLNIFQVVSYAGGNGDDGNGHGTHVSGTIGAFDNAGDEVAGVAPGARIWAVKVLNNGGTGSYSNIIAGIDYVTAHADEIEVANMSLGGGHSNALCSAIGNSVAAGVTYAVAAGNEDTNAGTRSPADCAGVITVSALADFDGLPGGHGSATCRADEDDTIANFSNWGSAIDIMAPGVCILSTWKNGGYNTISGTSMASPHVAGAAALVAASGAYDPATILARLLDSGTLDWDTTGDPDGIQEKLLNVANPAVFNPATVSGSSTPAEPPPANEAPTVTITAPADGANPASGAWITFAATATDTEDEDLAISGSVNWSSDVAGALGVGASIVIGDDESPLDDGVHIITARVNDSGAADGSNVKSGSDSITITVGSPAPAPDFTVADVSYSTSGGRLSNKHLTVVIDIDPDVVGTAVSILLENASGGSWPGTATTDAAGMAAFSLSNAPSGCYTATVTGINGADPAATPSNGIALRVDPATCAI